LPGTCTTRWSRPELSASAEARLLRDVREDDLDVLFEHQREPEGVAMAVFPAREREAFDAHWRKLLANDAAIVRTIEVDGRVAGTIGSWEQDGRQFVGYWLGRDFWGRGLATAALAELVQELKVRPLYAYVATSNVGSIRVLEKCGFARVEERHGSITDVQEYLYELA
jgi:RimJ/RimL family protein N-acetyltransferase